MSTYPHAKKRNTLKAVLIWALLMIPASGLLYSTSSHVRELEREHAAINQAIVQQKEALRVMRAEWAYLNNPERLGARAKTYLGFNTRTSAKQIARLNDMSIKIAYRGEAMSIAEAQALMQPAGAPVTTAAVAPRMLAQPIVGYTPQLVDSLAPTRNVKLQAAAGWSGKMVNASFDGYNAGTAKSRTMP